jgi:putative transposase
VDESSQHLNVNSQRVWSFRKLRTKRKVIHVRTNSIGCYMLNGKDVIMFPERTKIDDFCQFLEEVRRQNPLQRICLVMDNFATHKAKKVQRKAGKLNIKLVYLPLYSPDLNPIEFIWKSIKKTISVTPIEAISELVDLVSDNFIDLTKRISFARYWVWRFLRNKLDLLC